MKRHSDPPAVLVKWYDFTKWVGVSSFYQAPLCLTITFATPDAFAKSSSVTSR